MKIIHNTILKALALVAATALSAQAADFRIWTSLKGTSIEAQLVSFENGMVNLTTKAPKSIKLKATDLSLADRQYLVEFAEAKEDLLYKSKPSIPEKQYRKPKDFIKKLEGTLNLGDSDNTFELYETAHYVFACSKGVSPKGIAETAEACWHGMSFQHFEFRENWGDTKFLYVLPENSKIYNSVGKFVAEELTRQGQAKLAENIKATWERTGANYVAVPDDIAQKFKLKTSGRIFNTKNVKNYRKPWNPFQTHSIASNLFSEQVGGISSISGSGYFAISTGHSYYKEIQLARKTETNLLSKDYDKGVGSKSGFKNGTAWAKTLKKMVKKGDVKIDLMKTLAIKNANELDPPKLVTMYALSCYMQSTQKRIAAYARLCRQINTSDQVPAPSELAKIFGFESVEAFQKDWIAFIKSSNFK